MPAEDTGRHVVEVVLASRFPGLKRKLKTFDFKRRYGAEVKEIRQNGQVITDNLAKYVCRKVTRWCFLPTMPLRRPGETRPSS